MSNSFLSSPKAGKICGSVSAPLRLPKKSDGLFPRLHNALIFGPLCCQKICRCAAQTPAGAGFLQAFDSTRRGFRPLALPLQNGVHLLQAQVFRQTDAGAFPLPHIHSASGGKNIQHIELLHIVIDDVFRNENGIALQRPLSFPVMTRIFSWFVLQPRF